MKQTQKQIVLNKLREDGYVSRNWCLSQYISRLGAIMCALKEEGIHYEGENDGGDYIYKLVKKENDLDELLMKVNESLNRSEERIKPVPFLPTPSAVKGIIG